LEKPAKIPVSPEKVEGIVDEPVLPSRGEFGLQFGEIGTPFMDHDHFPVDDGLAGNIERAGNNREALGPVQPVAGVDLLFPALMWICTR
jgi:hypothetical protein